MAYMGGQQADFQQILEQIRNEDEMSAYAGVQQLSTHLSMAQDNQLRNIPLEEIIQALIAVLKRPALTDFSTEVKFHAVLSFTNLMDISPNLVSTVVNAGGVNCLCETMANAMHFLELIEACIKALEKISIENPYVILTSQALQISLNMIDFFDQTIQHKIIEIALHVSRHSANKKDYESYLLPIMPPLSQMLNMRGEQNKKLIENVTTVFLRISESFQRIHHQKVEFGQIQELYLTLMNCGIIDAFQQILVEASLNYEMNRTEDDSNRMFTPTTITQVLKLLTDSCKFNQIISNQQVNNNALKQVEVFLPDLKSQEQQQNTYLTSAISFIDSLVPEKAETLEQQEYPPEKVLCESDKKEKFSDTTLVASTAEKILPRLFKAYEDSISPQIRQKTLKVIDKIIALMEPQMLANFIEPYECAKFLFGIFKGNDLSQSLVCCQIVRQLCCQQNSDNTHQFVVAFTREGIFAFVSNLAKGKEQIETLYGSAPQKEQLNQNAQRQLEERLAEEKRMILERSAMLMERRKQEMESQGKTDQEMEERRRVEEQLMQKHLDLLQMKQKADLDMLQQKIQNAEIGQNSQTTKEQEIESLLKLSNEICQSKVLSKEFQEQMQEKHGDEVKVLKELTEIGESLGKKTDSGIFRENLKKLAQVLQGKQKITLHEFEQSGVLKALADFLTKTQSMILKEEKDLLKEQKQAETGEEDCKMEDETQEKKEETEEKVEISESEAKEALKRLKDFAELMVKGEHSPMLELVKLCHEEISANDTYIFKDSSLLRDDQAGDIFSNAGANQFFHNTQRSLDQMRAMSSRRLKITLEYDQKKSIMLSAPNQPPDLSQSKSSPPVPFASLQGDKSQNNAGLSKIFTKRDYLYNEMKSVSISVDHCASMWLLEDFLRQRIKSLDDVRSLKRQIKQPRDERSKQLIRNNEIAIEMIEAAKERLRDIMESTESEEQAQQESTEFAHSIAADIVDAIDNGELQEEEWPLLVKEMEVQSLVFMEEVYGEGHIFGAGNRRERDNSMSEEEGSGDLESQEAKLLHFNKMIRQLKDIIIEKRGKPAEKKEPLQVKQEVKKEGQEEESKNIPPAGEDQEMKEEAPVKKQQDAEEKPEEQTKKEQKSDTAQKSAISEDQSEPMAISESEEEESKGDQKAKAEIVKKQPAEVPVDLAANEEEEELIQEAQRKQPAEHQLEAIAKKMEAQGIEVSKKVDENNKAELDELIKANGEDIEFEFSIEGKIFQQNQTILEIINKQKRDKRNNGNPDTIVIKFAIKDFGAEQQSMRKDSLIEHTAFKDSPIKIRRSMSLAVSESETPAQLFISDLFLDKFKVFEEDYDEEEELAPQPKGLEDRAQGIFQSFQDLFGKLPGEEQPKFPEPPKKTEEDIQKEKEEQEKLAQKRKEKALMKKQQRASLLHAFKLLKVCHLVVNEPLLVSSNCELLLGSELDEQTEISEAEYLQKINQISPQVFCHNKLNQFLMKNIQDPYNLMSDVISGKIKDIFANCSFLFPFSTRMLFFKLMTFMGAIDMYRSIYFLKQFLKQRGANIQDDKNIGKTQKQKAQVDRSQVLRSAIHIMKHQKKQAFLEISYKDEPGTGLGPTLEFYHLVAQEVRGKPEFWKKIEDNSLFPAPVVMRGMSNEPIAQIYDVWRLVGCITAKSIVDDRIIDLPFNPLFWDLVLGKKTSLFDLNKIQPEVAKNFVDFQRMANRRKEIVTKFTDPEVLERQLSNIKTSFGAPIEEIGLNFTLPGEPTIELKPDGAKQSVSLENLQEYIDLTLHHTFHETLKLQLNAFKKGFNSIFSLESLKCFSYQEIEELICGEKVEEWTDVQRLSEIVVPAHGYHHKSPQFLDFLKYMTTLNQIDKRKFLQFVTGAPRLPLGGLAHLQPKLTVVVRRTENDFDSALPTVMTCVNYVKLPPYSNFDILKQKFDMAIIEGHNNFTLS